MRLTPFLILGLAAMTATQAAAQTAPIVTLRGVAYDSLHDAPLAGAFITVSGTSRSAVSDSRGAFQVDSVPAGMLTLVMQHEALDSLGIPSVSRRVSAASGATVMMVIPSFASVWRQACEGPPPRDSALIFGIVSDATGARRVRDAAVEASWYDYAVDAQNKVSQHQHVGRVRSDSTGAYTLCGVPSSMALRVQATSAAGRSAPVDLLPGTWRVVRRDLRIAQGADSLRRGTIAGAITANSTPLANARVAAEGMREVRTGRDGRFIIRDVAIGTRQVEISAIGLSPAVVAVDVVAGDTAFVARDLGKTVELPEMKISAPSMQQRLVAEFLERRKAGLGYFRDSADLKKYAVLDQVVREIPGAQVRMVGEVGRYGINVPSNQISQYLLRSPHGPCAANIILDGIQVESARLKWVDLADIAALEVYPDGTAVPIDIQNKLRRNASQYTCGAVVIWTKYKFQP